MYHYIDITGNIFGLSPSTVKIPTVIQNKNALFKSSFLVCVKSTRDKSICVKQNSA